MNQITKQKQKKKFFKHVLEEMLGKLHKRKRLKKIFFYSESIYLFIFFWVSIFRKKKQKQKLIKLTKLEWEPCPVFLHQKHKNKINKFFLILHLQTRMMLWKKIAQFTKRRSSICFVKPTMFNQLPQFQWTMRRNLFF